MLRPLNNYYLSLIINDLNKKMNSKKEELKAEPIKIRDMSNDRTINPQ